MSSESGFSARKAASRASPTPMRGARVPSAVRRMAYPRTNGGEVSRLRMMALNITSCWTPDTHLLSLVASRHIAPGPTSKPRPPRTRRCLLMPPGQGVNVAHSTAHGAMADVECACAGAPTPETIDPAGFMPRPTSAPPDAVLPASSNTPRAPLDGPVTGPSRLCRRALRMHTPHRGSPPYVLCAMSCS